MDIYEAMEQKYLDEFALDTIISIRPGELEEICGPEQSNKSKEGEHFHSQNRSSLITM